MRENTPSILGELSGIGIAIISSLKNDLIFPVNPPPLEEQLFSRVRGQSSLIRSQQDKLSYQAGVIEEQNRRIRDRDHIIFQRDKDVKQLAETNRSLEFQLREAASRNKRMR